MQIIEQLMRVALLGSEWVLYLLLGLSVVSFGIMIERELFFRQNARGSAGLRAALTRALKEEGATGAEAALAAHPSIESRVLRDALAFWSGGAEAISDAVEAGLSRERARLERGMTVLGTLGNNAPFIGLFGTVIGVVVAFHHLGGHDDNAMANVMASIAEALVATGVGIFVAIPAVIAFNVGQRRIGDIESDVHGLGKLLSAWSRTEDHETVIVESKQRQRRRRKTNERYAVEDRAEGRPDDSAEEARAETPHDAPDGGAVLELTSGRR